MRPPRPPVSRSIAISKARCARSSASEPAAGQEDVIRSVLGGHDTLAIMPTGAGKSLCYQLPALQFDGMTVIVSPLISLMRDQATKLTEAGIAAAVLNSALSTSEARDVMQAVAGHAIRMLFVTPERLVDAGFNAELAKREMPAIPLVVIDEAHCISQSGHDFRPAYVELVHAIKTLGRPPILALTATATPAVIADIVQALEMRRASVTHTGVYRDNLHFSVEQLTNRDDKRKRVIELTSSEKGSGIVYCATVAECDALHAALWTRVSRPSVITASWLRTRVRRRKTPSWKIARA